MMSVIFLDGDRCIFADIMSDLVYMMIDEV